MRIRTKLLSAFIFVSSLAVVVGIVSLIQLRRIYLPIKNDITESINELIETEKRDELAQLIRYYDEILTQSARNFVFTRERRWEQRYYAFEPELDDAIKQAIAAGDAEEKEIFASVDEANRELVRMELDAMRQVKEGNQTGAIALLEDDKYWKLKAKYENGLGRYSIKRGLSHARAFQSSAIAVKIAAATAQRIVMNSGFVIAAVFLIVILISTVVTIFLNQSVVEPLNQLSDYMQRVSGGNLSGRISSTTNDEIGMVTSSYNDMVIELQRTTVSRDELAKEIERRKGVEEVLRDSEIHIRTILDNVLDGIITMDEVGIIDSFNSSAERIFGFSMPEVNGHNVKMLMEESSYEEFDGYMEKHKNRILEDILDHRCELEGKRKDGNTFPLEIAISEMQLGSRRRFVGVCRDITARREVERMKDEFISTVSHELRTPLTSIRGSLGLILGAMGAELDEKTRSMLDIAYRNSERLSDLIDDILDIEKIESGSMDFKFEPTLLMPLIEQSVEANRAYGDQFGVTFAIEGSVPTAQVNVDSNRIIQVMNNLLSNAAKFSPSGSAVTIRISSQEQEIRIGVTDQGPGIPEEFHDSLFGKFVQVDSSTTRLKGGSGLGLSISKAIVERHGGSIGFNTQLNIGTTFYFNLPLWPHERVS